MKELHIISGKWRIVFIKKEQHVISKEKIGNRRTSFTKSKRRLI